VVSQRFCRGFSTAEQTELWGRWKRGESLKAIGRAFGKPSSSVYSQLTPHDGIRPSARHRARLALTLSEREERCFSAQFDKRRLGRPNAISLLTNTVLFFNLTTKGYLSLSIFISTSWVSIADGAQYPKVYGMIFVLGGYDQPVATPRVGRR
jgi:hypothetical protein